MANPNSYKLQTLVNSASFPNPVQRRAIETLFDQTALTDSTTGTAADTLAAGVGCQTLAFYMDAATIANGDLLTDYVPGYKFKILKFDARCAKAVTTGAKAATLNLEIGTTNLTGGAIALSGTYALGAAQAGTAVTAANTGTATDTISIEASGVTAFVEGAFWLLIEIQNMDTADAFATVVDRLRKSHVVAS